MWSAEKLAHTHSDTYISEIYAPLQKLSRDFCTSFPLSIELNELAPPPFFFLPPLIKNTAFFVLVKFHKSREWREGERERERGRAAERRWRVRERENQLVQSKLVAMGGWGEREGEKQKLRSPNFQLACVRASANESAIKAARRPLLLLCWSFCLAFRSCCCCFWVHTSATSFGWQNCTVGAKYGGNIQHWGAILRSSLPLGRI